MLVFDFDGTITDAEAEGGPFRRGYLEDVATLTGLAIDEVLSLAETFEGEVRANPSSHGWVFDGKIVAPATVDPYLRMMPVARMIFDHANSFLDPKDRDQLLDGILYKYNYQKTLTAFRDGATEVLEKTLGDRAFVVTNSHTDAVQRKIDILSQKTPTLAPWRDRVYGRAKKYLVDPSFDAVPEAIELPGLDRPVLLRRAYYHEVLSERLNQVGESFEDLVVIGDIFELDLALPLELGAHVGLVCNPFTPSYEREFVEQHPRARAITDLRQITEWVAELGVTTDTP